MAKVSGNWAEPVKRDWTPRLNGDIYCSPACGAKCKKSRYDQCVADAAILAERMGEGWTPHVWENLGWHYRIDNGKHHINPSRKYGIGPDKYDIDGYTAWVQTTPQFIETAETPQKAWALAVKAARKHLADITAVVERISPTTDEVS